MIYEWISEAELLTTRLHSNCTMTGEWISEAEFLSHHLNPNGTVRHEWIHGTIYPYFWHLHASMSHLSMWVCGSALKPCLQCGGVHDDMTVTFGRYHELSHDYGAMYSLGASNPGLA